MEGRARPGSAPGQGREPGGGSRHGGPTGGTERDEAGRLLRSAPPRPRQPGRARRRGLPGRAGPRPAYLAPAPAKGPGRARRRPSGGENASPLFLGMAPGAPPRGGGCGGGCGRLPSGGGGSFLTRRGPGLRLQTRAFRPLAPTAPPSAPAGFRTPYGLLRRRLSSYPPKPARCPRLRLRWAGGGE